MEKIPCSVLILTRNSAGTLPDCLRHLDRFAEVLIHDGNSTDETVQIAESAGAKVLKQYDTTEPAVPISDFTALRRKQLAEAACDWVFYLDSDESMSPELIDELAAAVPDMSVDTVGEIPRHFVVDGIVRTHGLGVPQYSARLCNRTGSARWRDDRTVHERLEYENSRRFSSAIMVPLPPIAQARAKDRHYLSLEADKLEQKPLSWPRYVRWVLWREPATIIALIGKIMLRLPRYLQSDSVPFVHEWRNVSYHWRLFWLYTRSMFTPTHRTRS